MDTRTAFTRVTSEFIVKISPINWMWIPIGLSGVFLSKFFQNSFGAQSTKIWIGIFLVFIWFWFGRKVRSIQFNGVVITLNHLGNTFPSRQSQKGFFFPEIEILASELSVVIKNKTVVFSDGIHSDIVSSWAQTPELKDWLNRQGIPWNLVNA